MADSAAQPLVICSTTEHKTTVIFVHGMGQLNTTWASGFIKDLAGRFPSTEWILPQAPLRPVSWNQGTLRPSWFDIWNLPPAPSEYDEESIQKSITTIQELIRGQVDGGMDPKNIFLMGFSQGAATGLCAALTAGIELGGVVSLSGWIPEKHRNAVPRAPSFPILWCHGTNDDEIPLSCGRDAEGFVKALPSEGSAPEVDFTFRTYDGLDHSTNSAELDDVASWLGARLQT